MINNRLIQFMKENKLRRAQIVRLFKIDQRSAYNYEKGSKIPHTFMQKFNELFPDKFMWFLTGVDKKEEENKELIELKKIIAEQEIKITDQATAIRLLKDILSDIRSK